MAELSRFWESTGVGDGPAAGYDMGHFYDFLRKILITDQEASQGVLRGVGSELAVSGVASPLQVADGAAIVRGFFYENSAALNLVVATPTTGITGGRINLKADWTAQTVRAVVQMSPDGTASIPALAQAVGSAWSIPLYTFTITQAGAITLTDVRNYCHFATLLEAADFLISGYSVIGRNASGVGEAEELTAADNQVLRMLSGVLGFGQVSGAMIANGAVTADKIAADAVDDTKAGDRVPQFYRRQGGNATDWSVAGTTDRTPGAVRMQAGVIEVTVSNGSRAGSAAVTFPTAFSNKPLIICTLSGNFDGSNYQLTPSFTSPATTGFTARVTRGSTSGDITISVGWLAIGPE